MFDIHANILQVLLLIATLYVPFTSLHYNFRCYQHAWQVIHCLFSIKITWLPLSHKFYAYKNFNKKVNNARTKFYAHQHKFEINIQPEIYYNLELFARLLSLR
ncbi:GSCOCG00006204001-RA-CDS [Cotesia congregata]|nr:GSCOCG00006204001-RA-CDS [Cotesia congregata]